MSVRFVLYAIFIIPGPVKLGGGGYTSFTMAVCLSVCLPVEIPKSGFHLITPFPFDIQWSYFTHVLPMTGRKPLLIFLSKVKVKFVLWSVHCFRTTMTSPFGIKWWYLICVSAMTQGRPLLISGLKGQGQGQIRTSNFVQFPHNNAISFWSTIMILLTLIHCDLTPIEFGF